MRGRLVLSREPPAPNTRISLPLVISRKASQQVLQGVVGMGVVHHDQEIAGMGDVHPPLDRDERRPARR